MKYQLNFETSYDWNRFAQKAGLCMPYPYNVDTIHYPTYMYTSKNREPGESQKGDWYNEWKKYYTHMPTFSRTDSVYASVTIDIPRPLHDDFEAEHKCKITKTKQSFWYGNRHRRYVNKVYTSDLDIKNKYPIYLPSKGRHDCCLTARTLLELGVDYFYIIVEEHQYNDYKKHYDEKHLIVLPKKYFDEYEVEPTFHDVPNRAYGPGPARNFAKDHSISIGAEKHHLWDDNSLGFVRFAPGNFRIPVKSPVFIAAFEDFADRWDNVAYASMNYRFFCISDMPAFYVNTRVYSYILLRNDVPIKWRGSRNEDTILSLDVLKAGWRTIETNTFLANKAATQTMKGGNNSDFYQKEGTGYKSQILYDLHPDCVQLITKYNRPHHFIDYNKHFPDKTLIENPNWKSRSPDDPEYGLYLHDPSDPSWGKRCVVHFEEPVPKQELITLF